MKVSNMILFEFVVLIVTNIKETVLQVLQGKIKGKRTATFVKDLALRLLLLTKL